jgi:hypothetical protein
LRRPLDTGAPQVNPARTGPRKKGAAMKVCATTTAVVNGSDTPHTPSDFPSSPARPKVSNRMSPATVGGMTIGRSNRTSTIRFPGN